MRDEIVRGEEAQRVLDNPLFKDAVNSVREGIVQSISTSAMGDEKTHNKLAIALQLLNQIEKNLITHIQTGKMAQIQVDEKLGAKLRRVSGF